MTALPSTDRLGRALPLPYPHLFIHVPKTGGTTLAHLLRWSRGKRHFAQFWVVPPPHEVEQLFAAYRLNTVFGHLSYGFHRWFESYQPQMVPKRGEFIYGAFFREPVERIISHYHFQRRQAGEQHLIARSNDLLGYAQQVDCNRMTRMLAGTQQSAWWNHPERDYEPPDPSNDPPVTRAMFETAAKRLRTSFGVVGITERFEDSLILTHHILGMPLMSAHRANRRRHPIGEHDRASREAVSALACWDVKLYQVALEVFDQQVEAFGGADALRAFRRSWRYRLRYAELLRHVAGPALASLGRRLFRTARRA